VILVSGTHLSYVGAPEGIDLDPIDGERKYLAEEMAVRQPA
jgi:hypothetical protein